MTSPQFTSLLKGLGDTFVLAPEMGETLHIHPAQGDGNTSQFSGGPVVTTASLCRELPAGQTYIGVTETYLDMRKGLKPCQRCLGVYHGIEQILLVTA